MINDAENNAARTDSGATASAPDGAAAASAVASFSSSPQASFHLEAAYFLFVTKNDFIFSADSWNWHSQAHDDDKKRRFANNQKSEITLDPEEFGDDAISGNVKLSSVTTTMMTKAEEQRRRFYRRYDHRNYDIAGTGCCIRFVSFHVVVW